MRAPWLAILAAPALLLAGACGGGSGSDDTGFRANLTDPASVPTLTRGDDARLYIIGSDGSISTEGEGSSVPGRMPTPANNGATAYTVQPGDTCESIASAFGISTNELRNANPLIDENCGNLRPDQSLRIPGGPGSGDPGAAATPTSTPPPGSAQPAPTEAPTSGGTTYTLQPGDFCGSIAEDFGVSLDELMAVNGLDADSCTRLDVGDVVIIP